MALPLLSGWRISGDALPERLLDADTPPPSFSLPGADALGAFAELLGLPAQDDAPAPADDTAPFPLPALLPGDAPGDIALSREIDFASLSGRRALLVFDQLCGRGEVELTTCPPRYARPGMPAPEPLRIAARFDCAPLTLDVTPALQARRRCRLTVRFESARPAGVCGAILLHVSGAARIDAVHVQPQPIARALSVCAQVTATRNGDYLLRAQLCPAQAPQDAALIRETALRLTAQEPTPVRLTLEADCPRFVPGTPYAAPCVKIQLLEKNGPSPALCDSRTLLCGFPGEAAPCFLPLSAADVKAPADALLADVQALHVPAVSLCAPAPEIFYRVMTRAGIGVRQTASPEARTPLLRFPCVTFDEAPQRMELEDLAVSAWRLCGLTTHTPALEAGLLPAELLREAAGREIDPLDEGHAAVLAWLRAVRIRLRAEAMRQGRLHGALCAPGEWRQEDIARAIAAAFAPLHLSALPLLGAWWAGARFSASLQAFIPESAALGGAPLRAEAILEDAQGEALARTAFSCAPAQPAQGLIEARLPDGPAVLELITRLYAGEAIIEESALPVYVGACGPLEAAFE